ncbi:unnamed protein product [Schistosoma margrebowiei]|uniref:Peptidase M28 domain-containing protein n=1 Tax=Schistosoma margrebowiei TaxID=48269 RepID=A0AA85AB74_9TREM|nr:unnamed protein product [Schistosoma margrebowiei]
MWQEISQNLCKNVSDTFLLEYMHKFCGGNPHCSGSKGNYEIANFIERSWKEWGWPIVDRQEFYVTLPLGPPENGPWNEVLLTNSDGTEVIHRAQNSVTVPPKSEICSQNVTVDNSYSNQLPVYQAYSCSGESFGYFVFVNYARRKDLLLFDKLQGRKKGEPSHICNKNVIVIARLGNGTRQSKLKNLMEHCTCGQNNTSLPDHHPGALILYPDPQDFAVNGLVYPHGKGLPGDAPVFGHMNMKYAGGGDPTCTGFPSLPHIYRTDTLVQGDALTQIPVQPIGYDDAKIFLSSLEGPTIPNDWDTRLATHLGPSTKTCLKVVVHNQVSKKPVKLCNVVGIMPGEMTPTSTESDQYVIMGNHHDAWVQGACDPGSGMVILQEIARILGEAYRNGFKPRRTIILGSWDGEEFSVLGSTHFVHKSEYELLSRCVVYINSDCPIKGHKTFSARTDSLLIDSLINAAKLVPVDPPVNMQSFYDEWLNNKMSDRNEPIITSLGGGSDHIPFAYRLGIPSTYPEFLPDDGLYNTPVYHTAYDIIDVVERFTDPASPFTGHFPRHRLIARLILTLIIQFACAPRLPLSILRCSQCLLDDWLKFMELVTHQIPNISEYDVNLDWVLEEIQKFKKSSQDFEDFANTMEKNCTSFPSYLNRILVGVSKHFVAAGQCEKSSLKNVIQGTTGYKSLYFPHVKSSFKNLKILYDKCKTKTSNSTELQDFKLELSNVLNCLQQLTNWLRNSWIGLTNSSVVL